MISNITRISVLALGALCFLHTQVRAQEMTGYLVIFPSVGLAPGERLRLTLFNPMGAPVRAQARIQDAGGSLVPLSDGSVRFIQPGVFHSFDVDRSDIPLTGEEGTARIQLRASFYIGIVEPGTTDKLAVSMETVSISDGTSNTVLVSEVILHGHFGNGNNFLRSGFGNVMKGIVPGQTLRVTIINPPFNRAAAGSETQLNPISGHVKVFDGSGDLIAQSDEFAIPPGEFRSFDFNRDALPSPGERGTNRLELRVKPFFDFSSPRLSRVLMSFEIVDNSTGKTRVLTGQQCQVFFLGGIPSN